MILSLTPRIPVMSEFGLILAMRTSYSYVVISSYNLCVGPQFSWFPRRFHYKRQNAFPVFPFQVTGPIFPDPQIYFLIVY
jgi:hypothetical protein